MTLEIRTDTAQVSAFMRNLFHDQLPFVAAQAVNATALEFQRVQRAHQRSIFEVRRPVWVDRSVKLKPRATKQRPEARIRVDPPGGRSRADITGKFETERRKRPRGGTRLAIPIEARRTSTGVVSKAGRLKSFDLHRVSARTSKGLKRVFVIREPGGRGFVFQRKGRRFKRRRTPGLGRRRGDARLLYIFRPEVPISPELHFVRNAVLTVRRTFDRHYSRAFTKAVRTARSGFRAPGISRFGGGGFSGLIRGLAG